MRKLFFKSKFLALFVAGSSLSSLCLAQETIMRNDMFDYDQKRSTVPNDGKQYCVPTSYMNHFAYMANHGLPNMRGGFGTSYSDVSSWEFFLGFLMGTDPSNGTNQETAFGVATSWIHDHTSKLVYNYFYGPGWDWSWRTIRNSMRIGGLARIGYGRYYRGNGEWIRDSGHSVTVAGFQDDGNGNRQFVVADPSSSDSLNSQSTFTLSGKPTSDITFTTQNDGQVKHARYTFGTGDNGNWRYVIDSMHTIHPMISGWQVSTRASSRIHVEVPFQFNEASHSWPSTFDVIVPDSIVDWCFDLRTAGIAYINSDGLIFELDLDGTRTQIANIPGAKQIVTGGIKQDLFVLVDNLLSDTLHFVNRNGTLGVVKSLGTNVASLDYDPVTQGPVVVSANLNKVMQFSHSLGQRTDVPLSRILPWLKEFNMIQAGNAFLRVDHSNGDYILARVGDDHWERFTRVNGSLVGKSVTFRASSGITAITPSENGVMFVQDGNTLKTLDQFGNVVATDFNGMSVSTNFRIPRSDFAADPASFLLPGWNEIPSDDIWP